MLVDKKKMETAKKEIEKASGDFKKMGAGFISSLTTVLNTFEGETKDVLIDNKIGISGGNKEETLAYFVENQIPELLKGLSDLLDGNMETIKEGDQKLADAISGKS